MNTWKLEENTVPLARLRQQESLFAQGNGYLGWRGTFEEGLEGSLEGTYLNGFYETYPISYPEIAYAYPCEGQAMLNLMNAKQIRILLEGEDVRMDSPRLSGYHRELDFATGLLTRRFAVTTPSGKGVEVCFQRLVSFARLSVGAIHCRVTSLDYQGELQLLSALNTRSQNQVADKDPRVGAHLPSNCFTLLEKKLGEEETYALAQTLRSGFRVACATRHGLQGTGQGAAARRLEESGDLLEERFTFSLQPGQSLGLSKFIAYAGQTHPGEGEPLTTAREEARKAEEAGFEALLLENEAFLKAYWERSDVRIEGDDALQQGLRFNGFHILQSVGRDGGCSIAAKGLTGEGYEGHVFWDTEMFVIPSLLYSQPDICRNLLAYRYHRLPEARARARDMGHGKGAMFPWRTIGGSECSTFFPAGTAQYHINGDIALAVKNYVQTSGDEAFLEEMGAELLFEIARLWESLGHFSPEKNGRFCIDCVTGPDEYTALVNNNFYTNRIARESLWYAREVYEKLLKERPELLRALGKRLNLAPGEPKAWQRAADRMYFPYEEGLRVNLQDDSFMGKAEWNFEGTPKEQYPLLMHFHPLVIYRHKVLKQADVVLADLLFDAYESKGQIQRDFDYYEARTTHDSSLSACIHSMVACRIGALEKAYAYFMRTARTDLDDHKGNTKDGVHIANMAGTAMCLIHGFAGVRQRNGQLSLRPVIPPEWTSYAFELRFLGRRLAVTVSQPGVQLALLEGEALPVKVFGEAVRLEKGGQREQTFSFHGGPGK